MATGGINPAGGDASHSSGAAHAPGGGAFLDGHSAGGSPLAHIAASGGLAPGGGAAAWHAAAARQQTAWSLPGSSRDDPAAAPPQLPAPPTAGAIGRDDSPLPRPPLPGSRLSRVGAGGGLAASPACPMAAVPPAAAAGGDDPEPALARELGVTLPSLERLFRAEGRHDFEQPVWMVVNLQVRAGPGRACACRLAGCVGSSSSLDFTRSPHQKLTSMLRMHVCISCRGRSRGRTPPTR
jgi:hypothetical protein